MVPDGTKKSYKIARRHLLYRGYLKNAKAKKYCSQYRFEQFFVRPQNESYRKSKYLITNSFVNFLGIRRTWSFTNFRCYRCFEVVYVTIGNPAFCLGLYLTRVHFRGELQHVGYVGEEKIKCRLIRTWEIAGVRL